MEQDVSYIGIEGAAEKVSYIGNVTQLKGNKLAAVLRHS
jgi:hypothetical protein